MIKELKYNGHTANPSDYECADGDLALAIGVINEDGGLKPLLPPKPATTAGGTAIEGNVVFTHETASFTHYIFYEEDNGTVWGIDKGTGGRLELDVLPGDLIRFSALGNILLALTSEGLCYYYWRNDKYVCLGGHVPEIDLSFGLVGHPRIYSVENGGEPYHLEPVSEVFEWGDSLGAKERCRTKFYDRLNDDHEQTSSDRVMALVNKYLADQTVNEGRFCLPFFVRYAVRLYDGSYIHQSAPVLMTPSTYGAMTMYISQEHIKEVNDDSIKKDYWRFEWAGLNPLIVACDLDYMLVPNADTANLESWRDIIAGVDIFVSPPIYTHDQDGGTKGYFELNEAPRNTFVGRLYFENTDGTYPDKPERDKMSQPLGTKGILNSGDVYAEWDYDLIYSLYMLKSGESMPARVIRLPAKEAKDIADDICNTSTFYLLHSIDFEEILTLCKGTSEGGKLCERQTISVGKEYLQSLVARKILDDDYNSHDVLYAKSVSTYNNRLNLSGVRRQLFGGFSPLGMFSYCNSDIVSVNNGADYDKPESHSVSVGKYGITVYIRENGEYKVRSYVSVDPAHRSAYKMLKFESLLGDLKSNLFISHTFGCYLFYPNPSAYKMAIYYNDPDAPAYAVDLKPHDLLNGAYAFLGFDQLRKIKTGVSSLPAASQPVVPDMAPEAEKFPLDCAGKLFTSEANNPFFFPTVGINTIGTGIILATAAAVKALSEGQFGQFPLYAFTTEGVWALEVSATGGYSAKQPVTRDVCINPEGITQLDNSVLFPTKRGIMLISGSETTCISDAIDSVRPFSISDIPKGNKLVDIYNRKNRKEEEEEEEEDTQVAPADISLRPFQEFLAGCRMIYDYTNQHVIVYNPDVRYAYVFSLKSKMWGMIRSDIQSNPDSYPEALAVLKDGALADFSSPDVTETAALVITRPFVLDNPDIFKTVDTVIQRGYFQRDHVAQVLYGSNDLLHWFTVWSSVDMYMRGFRGSPYKYFRLALICKLSAEERISGCTVQFTPRLLNQPR